jgi:hypothetical protein
MNNGISYVQLITRDEFIQMLENERRKTDNITIDNILNDIQKSIHKYFIPMNILNRIDMSEFDTIYIDSMSTYNSKLSR